MRFVWFFSLACVALAQTKTIGVCDALNSSTSYQEVAIHASFSLWMEGAGFFESSDGSPCPGWPRRFFTAPAFIGVQIFAAHGVRLTPDQEKANFAFLERMRTLSDRGIFIRTLTIKGILVKKIFPFIFRGWDGQYVGKGFRPNGGEFAELVITEPPTLP